MEGDKRGSTYLEFISRNYLSTQLRVQKQQQRRFKRSSRKPLDVGEQAQSAGTFCHRFQHKLHFTILQNFAYKSLCANVNKTNVRPGWAEPTDSERDEFFAFEVEISIIDDSKN